MNLFSSTRTVSPAKSSARSAAKADDGLGRGMEFAIVVFAFLGVGYVLDRWLDTKPLFMIVLVVLSLVGQFASMWYGYDARMKQLEEERAKNTIGVGRPGRSASYRSPATPSRPDQSRPDQSRPDQSRPDQSRPDQSQPDRSVGADSPSSQGSAP